MSIYRQHSELVLRSLAEDDKAADVLDRLRSGEAIESIAIRLSTGSVHTEKRLEIRPPIQNFDPVSAVFGQPVSDSTIGAGAHTDANTIPGSGDEGPSLQYPRSDDMGFGWDTPHDSFGSSSNASIQWSPDIVGSGGSAQSGANTEWPIIGNWMPYTGDEVGTSQRDRGREYCFILDCGFSWLVPAADFIQKWHQVILVDSITSFTVASQPSKRFLWTAYSITRACLDQRDRFPVSVHSGNKWG